MPSEATSIAAQPAATPPPSPEGKKPEAAQPAAVNGAAQAPQPGASTPATVDAAKDKLEAAGGDVPDQKRGESNEDYEIRLSQLTRELRAARREAQANKVDKQTLETMKAELEKAKNKRMTKNEFVQFVKDLDAGKLQLDDDEWAALPQAVRDRLEKLENAEALRQKEIQERQQSEQRTKEEGIVAKRLQELATDLPLFEGSTEVHKLILDAWYERFIETGQKPNLDQVMEEIHDGLASTVGRALQSEVTRRFLVGKYPDLKALLGAHEAKASGPTSSHQGAGGGTGSAAKPDAPSLEPPATPRDSTRPKSRLELEEEKLEASRAAYREHQRSARGG